MPDFLGAFAVIERDDQILMVANDRQIGGRTVRTWDLPGGRVEAGEQLHEAVAREIDEETGLQLLDPPRFLFVQEGERCHAGQRQYSWRSFFFAASVAPGEPAAGHEVLAVRWLRRDQLAAALTAPYHDSFLHWVASGGHFFRSTWRD